MENASKALIIAGAILLAILIISLGIMIYNQASGVVNNNAMTEVEISSFNQKFTQYGTSNVRGAQVNALLQAVVNNNISNSNDTSKQVKVTLTGSNWSVVSASPATNSAVWTKMQCEALTGKTYTITYEPDTTTGLITLISVH